MDDETPGYDCSLSFEQQAAIIRQELLWEALNKEWEEMEDDKNLFKGDNM